MVGELSIHPSPSVLTPKSLSNLVGTRRQIAGNLSKETDRETI